MLLRMMKVVKAQRLLAVTLLCAVAYLATFATGQGFQRSDKKFVGVTQSYQQYQQLYSRSKDYKLAFKLDFSSACNNTKSGNLCASVAANITDSYAELLLATSPLVYSSTDARSTGGIWLVAPPMDQQTCDTCSAFAVASAAETAMAAVLGVSVSECSISVQALHFCPPGDRPGRYCRGGVTLDSVLDLLKESASELLSSKCMSYKPNTFNRPGADDLCSSSCDTPNQHAAKGKFSYQPVTTMWEAQLHIRQYGAVVTRFDIMDDFRTFFNNPGNAKAVYKPGAKAQYALGHAIVLVGYNNEEQYWVAKNSWGVGWADYGYFKVAYGTCGILVADGEAYGVTWIPKSVPAARLLSVVPGRRAGCYLYQAGPGDYMSRVALSAGIPLNKFVEDNADIVKDLDAPLDGKQLVVCNAQPGSFTAMQTKAATINGSQGTTSDPQLESLLQIKAALDTQNVLKQWSRDTGANAGYCNWTGIQCADQMVINITLGAMNGSVAGVNLHGTLPLASAFSGLSFLRVLGIRSPSITGTLPEDWFQLAQLEELQLGEFPFGIGFKGTLPASWGSLTQLKVLRVFYHSLSGEIPETFRALTRLEVLDLSGLLLVSTTLPAWLGSFTKLRELHVRGTYGTEGPIPDAFKSLTSLEVLDLSFSRVNGPIPAWLGNLRKLHTISLDGCKLTGSIPNSMSALSQLQVLSLSFNQLTGTIPAGVGSLRHLRALALSGPLPGLTINSAPSTMVSSGLRGNIPDALGNLKNLTRLWLGGNKLTGTLPESFSGLQRLRELALSNNNLSGTIPSSWSNMTDAWQVSLYNNGNLKGCLPKTWNKKCKGCMFQYHNTRITGFCP